MDNRATSPLRLALAAAHYWTFGEMHRAFHRLPAKLRKRQLVDRLHAWIVGNGGTSQKELLFQAEVAVGSLQTNDDEEEVHERLMVQHAFDYARTAPVVEYTN